LLLSTNSYCTIPHIGYPIYDIFYKKLNNLKFASQLQTTVAHTESIAITTRTAFEMESSINVLCIGKKDDEIERNEFETVTTLLPYQIQAYSIAKDCNALVVLPEGLGRSLITAQMCLNFSKRKLKPSIVLVPTLREIYPTSQSIRREGMLVVSEVVYIPSAHTYPFDVLVTTPKIYMKFCNNSLYDMGMFQLVVINDNTLYTILQHDNPFRAVHDHLPVDCQILGFTDKEADVLDICTLLNIQEACVYSCPRDLPSR
jgi:hypothetical protein